MSNLRTGLRRRAGGMAGYDALPQPLRAWIASAALPWSAHSVHRLWQRALAEGCCHEKARARLDLAEARALSRDAPKVWGHSLMARPLTAQLLTGALAKRR